MIKVTMELKATPTQLLRLGELILLILLLIK